MSTREQAILYWILILIFLSVVFGRKNAILDSLMNVVKYTIHKNPLPSIILAGVCLGRENGRKPSHF
ncbi:hypothetical protein HB795_03835 [Listeria welshimeri]|nr:hypothetical protein [Listeria welshimeri]MBC2298633.1 hypothetical protein [Listeria welshimeri]